MTPNLRKIIVLSALISLPALAAADESVPEFTTEGLALVDKDHRGEIYADEGIDWNLYSEVILDRPTVAFRKNWLRDQNRNSVNRFRVRADDMERIKSELADQFEEVFAEELTTNGGYTLVSAAGEQVMRITPHIVDLDVYAPDTQRSSGFNQQYTESAGKMTLKLTIHDSVTGDLIAAIRHRQEAPRRGYMQWTTSVSNRNEARRMLQNWASGLRERLDEARSK